MTKIHRINYQDLFDLRQKFNNKWFFTSKHLKDSGLTLGNNISPSDVEILESLMDAAIYRDTLEIYGRLTNRSERIIPMDELDIKDD